MRPLAESQSRAHLENVAQLHDLPYMVVMALMPKGLLNGRTTQADA